MQWALQPLFMAIAATLVALSSVFAWRHTLKPMLSLLLAAAAGAYFMLSYSIVIDSSMLVAVGAGRKWHLLAWQAVQHCTGYLQQTMRNKRISHDSYFHSVPGLLDVQTALHQPALDA